MAATAYAALVSLQNTLCLIDDHPRHRFYFEKEQIYSLWGSVVFLIEFMRIYDNCYGAIKEAAGALDSRIARVVQAAEDVIESHIVDQIRCGSTLGGNARVYFLLDLQKAIQDVKFVARKAYNLSKSKSGVGAEQPTFSATTSSASEKNKMVGFDDQLHRLLDMLTGEPSSQLQVIPIVGMGGIGKTTLATNALQHPYIAHYFDVCLWATISQEFDLKRTLSVLLAQIKQKTCFLSNMSTDLNSVDELGVVLHKCLYGRRYLIILDDMWSVEAWDELKFFFPDTCNGSRIVVTTRQSDVADHLQNWIFDMKLLDMESSWDLFCQRTFEEQGCPPELEDIGKKIAQNCRGLPLAIVVVGGHLQQSSREIEYWANVAKDMSSVLNSSKSEECLNILSLSYRYLPVYLKPCFISLGVFPEDQEISMSDIYNLWIGEGFLTDSPEFTLEEVAFCSLVDLTQRNLISFTKQTGLDRTEIFFRVHDLLRELCLKIAKKEGFLSTFDTRRTINGDRQVVMKGKIPKVNHQQQIFGVPRSAAVVRSLICEGGQLSYDLKLLRVLKKVDSLETKINIQQVNLRYLKVDVLCKSSLPISIPSSVSLLWNLQTLIIYRDDGSILAPYEIWEIPQLRHVEVDQLCLPHPLPVDSLDMENDSVLKNLRTLSKVENFMLSEEVCRRIPNNEELKLSYCGEPSLDYCLHNLVCFQKLRTLECYFDGNGKWHDFASSLTFPNSLQRLRLRGCYLDWEELTGKVGFLPHLETLELYRDSVNGSEWNPVEEEFLELRELKIYHCDLVRWNAEYFHFPMLEVVHLEGLSVLDEIPSGIGEIPTLQSIHLVNCSLPSTFSAIRMVVEQEEQGNEELIFYFYLEGDEETLEDFKQKVEKEGLRKDNIYLGVGKVSQDKSIFICIGAGNK